MFGLSQKSVGLSPPTMCPRAPQWASEVRQWATQKCRNAVKKTSKMLWEVICVGHPGICAELRLTGHLGSGTRKTTGKREMVNLRNC